MKILYIITKSNWGGAQKYVFDLAKNIKSEEREVKVAFGGNGLLSQKLNDEKIETDEKSEEIKVVQTKREKQEDIF